MPAAKAYAAQSAETPLAPYSFERRELRPNDVRMDILYCGVCHSDLHTVRSDGRDGLACGRARDRRPGDRSRAGGDEIRER